MEVFLRPSQGAAKSAPSVCYQITRRKNCWSHANWHLLRVTHFQGFLRDMIGLSS